MDLTIHASFLPHDDPDASLAFYRLTGAQLQADDETDRRSDNGNIR